DHHEKKREDSKRKERGDRNWALLQFYLSTGDGRGRTAGPTASNQKGSRVTGGPTRHAPHTTITASGVAADLRCPRFPRSLDLREETLRAAAADGGTAGRVALTSILALASIG
ncbi:unnamed protein product, partial [Musa textilis]